MTAKYFAILTNQGAARLANAAALGTKLNLTQMAVGDANGTLPTPDPAQTKLINQKRIAPLNLLTIDPANTSQIIAEQIIPENEGGFWIREIGLYDDAGVLIAVANCPETYKPQLQEGSGRTQTIRMILIVSSTSAITLKIDPSVVLATRQYVDDKVIEVKAYADELLKKHVDAANPHKQYPLIVNALKEMADAGIIGKVFENLGLGNAATRAVGEGANQIPDISSFKFEHNFPSANGYALLDLPHGFKAVIGTFAMNFTNPAGSVAGTPITGVCTLPSAFPNKILAVIACGCDGAAQNAGYVSVTSQSGDGRTKFGWNYRSFSNPLTNGATYATYLAIGV